jgi:hypothetical protein
MIRFSFFMGILYGQGSRHYDQIVEFREHWIFLRDEEKSAYYDRKTRAQKV